MKKFLLRTLLFLGLIVFYKLVLVLVVLYCSSDVANNDFYGKNSGKPKIILVGSSNVEHNYDYAALNAHFSGYDIIGSAMCEPSGFYAGVYKLKKLSPSSKDIIIFCLPHSLYELDKFLPLRNRKVGFTPGLLLESFRYFPQESFQAVASLNVLNIYELLRNNTFKQVEKEKLLFEAVPAIQKYEPYMRCEVGSEDKFYIGSLTFEKDYLLRLKTFLDTHFDAKVLFRFPSVKENEFEINKERIEFLTAHYPFTNTFKSSAYGHQYWFNQWYHLNACGRDLNTEKLIRELEPIVNSAAGSLPCAGL